MTSSLFQFPDKWARLCWGVWQANRQQFDVPEWLNRDPVVPFDNCFPDETLPLHYGIELDSHVYLASPAEPMRAQMVEWPLRERSLPLLQFPLAGFPGIARHPAVFTGDSVLPFRVAARQTIAVFSLTGGTGRTSLAASLARLLAGTGLHVLLVDTSAFSLLPRLFGGGDCRQGVLRTFLPTVSEMKGIVSIISLAVEPFAGDDYEQYRILQEVKLHAARADRVVWDLSGAPLDWASKILGDSPQILVPLLPDMNSLMQLRATERFVNRCHEDDPSAHLRYVLNHFNEEDALHQDMRVRFQRKLGTKLLRASMRCSSLVDEALYCGRTVIDHAPGSLLVDDLWQMAQQLHQVDESTPSPVGTPSEWYEQ